jgi:hypothetical protein
VDIAHAAPAQERADDVTALPGTLGVEPIRLELARVRGHPSILAVEQTLDDKRTIVRIKKKAARRAAFYFNL